MVYVVIPCYKVRKHITDVLKAIGDEVDKIIIVDDKCPENTGQFVQENIKDPRIKVIFHNKNKGVGGAVKTGFRIALQEGAEIAIKLDGDGQMNPLLIPYFIKPIIDKKADYVKGNRFYNLDALNIMPSLRVFGNSALSLVNKIVTGYWNIMDPTNGFVAIHKNALQLLPLDKISNKFFFESDMLFRLRIVNAVIYDLPVNAKYGNEKSNLSIKNVLFKFPFKYIVRFLKRIIYMYYLYDFNLASISIIFGLLFILFGTILGIIKWIDSIKTGVFASCGTVMLTALPIILGFQLFIFVINYDIQNIPNKPLCTLEPPHGIT
jgi:dolichol-phosphate mannosyltransferase